MNTFRHADIPIELRKTIRQWWKDHPAPKRDGLPAYYGRGKLPDSVINAYLTKYAKRVGG